MNTQNALALIIGLTKNPNPILNPIAKTRLTDEIEMNAPSGGLLLLRLRGTDVQGQVVCTINNGQGPATVYQVDTCSQVDSGEAFIVCDSLNAMSLTPESGTVTVEGYEYVPSN